MLFAHLRSVFWGNEYSPVKKIFLSINSSCIFEPINSWKIFLLEIPLTLVCSFTQRLCWENVSLYQFQLYFWANKSMRIISFRNTADTSLLIYTENAGKMNIPWGGIYSKLENKTWSYWTLFVRLFSSKKTIFSSTTCQRHLNFQIILSNFFTKPHWH